MTLSPRRSVIAASLLAFSALVGTASPAAAAEPTPSFQIFYGPSCATAYRTYVGPNTLYAVRQEPWINDTFNASQASSPGYGQLIKKNAASVRIQPRTHIGIKSGSGKWWFGGNSSYTTSTCWNLNDWRNNNVEFRVQMYNSVLAGGS